MDGNLAMANSLENNVEPIPAIPPEDYKGRVGRWMIALQERGLWDGEGWHGDIEITNEQWWEILEECEG